MKNGHVAGEGEATALLHKDGVDSELVKFYSRPFAVPHGLSSSRISKQRQLDLIQMCHEEHETLQTDQLNVHVWKEFNKVIADKSSTNFHLRQAKARALFQKEPTHINHIHTITQVTEKLAA